MLLFVLPDSRFGTHRILLLRTELQVEMEHTTATCSYERRDKYSVRSDIERLRVCPGGVSLICPIIICPINFHQLYISPVSRGLCKVAKKTRRGASYSPPIGSTASCAICSQSRLLVPSSRTTKQRQTSPMLFCSTKQKCPTTLQLFLLHATELVPTTPQYENE
jgi:hypothetical protein